MQRLRALCIALFFITIVLKPGLSVAQTDGDETERQRPARVIVISIDGARPDAIQEVDTPNIGSLVERGAVSWTARTVLPSSTIPAHTTMLTGMSVRAHTIVLNPDYVNCEPIPMPTFLSAAYLAGYRTALAAGKPKFCIFDTFEELAFSVDSRNDWAVATRAIERLQQGYEVIMVHFASPDNEGHSAGWMSGRYLRRISEVDHQIGRILDTLDELGLTEETLIIITADHGGAGRGHGTSSRVDMRIPFIIAGPGVVPGTQLVSQVGVINIAPTVLWALGLPIPNVMEGLPVLEAFGLRMVSPSGPR